MLDYLVENGWVDSFIRTAVTIGIYHGWKIILTGIHVPSRSRLRRQAPSP